MSLEFGNENQLYIKYNENENIGGYIEGDEQRRIYANPETLFFIDLLKNYKFLDNYISSSDFDILKDNLNKFHFKLFRNPTLILISYIIYKRSSKNSIDVDIFKKIYFEPIIQTLIQEYKISKYDILRYCRYFLLNFN